MTDIHSRDELYKHVDERFDELDRKVEKIAERKQDKLPKGALAAFALTIFGQLLLIAFMWGSQSQQLETATSDRYRGQDAVRDFALRDARDANIETELLEHGVRIEELRKRIRALETGE